MTKIDSGPPGHANAASVESKEVAAPQMPAGTSPDIKAAARKLASLMHKPGPEGQENDLFSFNRFKDEAPGKEMSGDSPSTTGNAILDLFHGSVHGNLKPVETPKDAAPPSIADAVREIADRILVSDKSLGGREEVRITLKESVLPGTEIRVFREEGKIQIELVTTRADSQSFLAEHQDQLQDQLKTRLNDDVRVVVQFQGADYEGSDGRSRQQRNLYDEIKDDEIQEK